ncbi:shematrin-like protein 1 [Uloborus diversus]|uniref:shematrin-like protein 1 n=1 Tax=Uloborus diversus TaxID=327109 RepID=UPI002409CACE|nr:shematrin-like protein 1 [Uloborus diversus]
MSWELFLSILLLAAVAKANENGNSELDNERQAEEEVVAFESFGAPVYGPNEPTKSGGIPPKGVPAYGLPEQPLFSPINANYAAYLSGIGLANPFGYAFGRYGASPYNAYGYGGSAAYAGLGYGAPYAGNWGYGNSLYNKAPAMYSGLGYGLPAYGGYRYGGLGYPAPANLRNPGALPGPVPAAGPYALPGSVPPLALPGAVPGALTGVPAPYPAVAPFAAAPVPLTGPYPYKTPATTQAKDGTLKYVSPRMPLY